MKTKTFIYCMLASIMLCSSNAFARRVYVRLASDATAWSHVTADFDNVVITLPEGSTDFTKNALVQLRPGDEVWVAKGVYNNSGMVTLCNDENAGLQYGNIQMYGGFAGTETSPAQRAVADKDENGLTEPWEFVNETNFRGRGNSKENATNFQLVQLGGGSLLDGVTLSDNYLTGASHAAGGDISSLIRNCTVRDLTTEYGTGTIYGGGLYVTGGQVESCLIETCKAIVGDPASTNTIQGGGVHLYGTNDKTLEEAPTGCIKNSVIRNCTAGEGSNMGRGGAIFGKNGVVIENCVVYNNQASHTGGAFYFHKKGDEGKQVNRVINCTMVNNATIATSGTPSTCIAESGYAEFYNTVFWGNTHVAYPSAPDSYQNTIRLFASTSSAYPYMDGIAFNGMIQSPEHNKNGSFNPIMLASLDGAGQPIEDTEGVDPMFTNAIPFAGAALNPADLVEIRKGNFTLKEGSPLIDAGLNEPSNKIEGYDKAATVAAFSGKDALGAERNVGEKFDIGAYEYGVEYVIGPNRVASVSESNHKVLARANRIEVTGLETPATIRLYSANGALLTTVHTTEATATLDVENQGFYIVSLTVGNETYSEKVVM